MHEGEQTVAEERNRSSFPFHASENPLSDKLSRNHVSRHWTANSEENTFGTESIAISKTQGKLKMSNEERKTLPVSNYSSLENHFLFLFNFSSTKTDKIFHFLSLSSFSSHAHFCFPLWVTSLRFLFIVDVMRWKCIICGHVLQKFVAWVLYSVTSLLKWKPTNVRGSCWATTHAYKPLCVSEANKLFRSIM